MASFGRLNLNSDVFGKDKALQYFQKLKEKTIPDRKASRITITSDQVDNSPFKRLDSNRLIKQDPSGALKAHHLNDQQADNNSTPLFSEIGGNSKP